MKVIIFSISVFYIIFGSFISFAQDSFSMEGRVISGVNGKPLNEVLIKVRQNHQLFALTDKFGFFKIDNIKKGKYVIEIEYYDGYDKFDSSVFVNDFSVKDITITLKTQCKFSKESALQSIRDGANKILIWDSLIGIRIHNKLEEYILKHYHIEIYRCDSINTVSICAEEHNQVIFAYLDKTYGRSLWYAMIKNYNPIGLEEYIKYN